MTQQLRALATLPEDPVLVPNTHIMQLTTTCNSSSKRSDISSLGYMHSICKHTHTHKDFFLILKITAQLIVVLIINVARKQACKCFKNSNFLPSELLQR